MSLIESSVVFRFDPSLSLHIDDVKKEPSGECYSLFVTAEP